MFLYLQADEFKVVIDLINDRYINDKGDPYHTSMYFYNDHYINLNFIIFHMHTINLFFINQRW